MVETVSDRTTIAAGLDTVYEVIADFPAYPRWQPEIVAVEVLATDADGRGTRVRFVIDARIVRATVVLDYDYDDAELRWKLVEGDVLNRNDGSYVLADLGGGLTEVVYTLALEVNFPLPGMLRRRAADRLVEAGLANLKRRVESA